MSREDLLIDLRDDVVARASATPPQPPVAPPVVPQGVPAVLTPALDVSVTPLRWSMPSVGPAAYGFGLAVRVGPLQVALALR